MKALRTPRLILSYAGPPLFFWLLLKNLDRDLLVSSIRTADWRWLALAFLLVPLSVLNSAVAWRILIRPAVVPFRRLAFVLSQWGMMEQILPFRMSEGVKVYYLGVEDRIGKTEILAALFGEEVALGGAKILFLMILMALGGLPTWLTGVAIAYVAIVFFLVLASLRIVRCVRQPLTPDRTESWRRKIGFHLRNWIFRMHAVKSWRRVVGVSLLLFLKMTLEGVALLLVGCALGLTLSPLHAFSVVAALYLVILFMITPGHFGVLEGVAILVLGSYGMPPEKGLVLSTTYHVVLSVSFVLTGFLARLLSPHEKSFSRPAFLKYVPNR